MKRNFGTVLFLAAAVCLYLFGVLGSEPAEHAGEIFYPFTSLSSTMVLLIGGALVFFLAGAALVLTEKKLPGDREEFVRRYAAVSRLQKNHVWEWGLIANGVLAAIFFAALFTGTLKGWPVPFLGAFFLVVAAELVIGIILIVFFIMKEERSLVLFLPGVGLFLVEVVCVALVIVFGLQGPK